MIYLTYISHISHISPHSTDLVSCSQRPLRPNSRSQAGALAIAWSLSWVSWVMVKPIGIGIGTCSLWL